MPPAVDLLGVRVHRLRMGEAVNAIMDLVASGGHHQIVTVNAIMLYEASRNERFRSLLNSASLALADGMGVLLIARILGRPTPEKVSGVDLSERLCAACAPAGVRVFLLGAAPGIAARAAANLQKRYPGLQIAGVQHGYFELREHPSIIRTIREAQTEVLLVALGSPRQEEWIAARLHECGATVGMGVGGSLDVFAGRVKLAPEWIRRAGLEWAYRLIREPSRWRVQAVLPLVLLLAIKERLKDLLRGKFGKKGN